MFESILVGVLTGLASSAAASFVFLRFYVNKLRPKFEIGKQIAWESSEGGGRIYRIKLINKSSFRAYEIKLNFYKVTSTNAGGASSIHSTPAQIYHFEDIPLSCNQIDCLEKYDPKDPNAFYALQVRCFESLERNWPTNAFLRISVSGLHSLSGLRGSETYDFANARSCLLEGVFYSGRDLDVH
jgi:hypothetical protein